MAFPESVNCACKINDNRLSERLDSIMDAHYTDNAPGGALLIAKDGLVLYDSGRGIADVVTKVKIDGNTLFNIASLTKQFTVISVLKLQEKGLLDINDCVRKYFPSLDSKIWDKVKLHHLLSHCSGIPDARPRSDRNFTLYATDMESIDYMKYLDYLKFEPGTNYDYINPTYDLFYALIERVTGMSFEEYQSKEIFEVLKMSDTRYFSTDKNYHDFAHAYIVNEKSVSNGIDSDYAKVRDVVANDYIDDQGKHWVECDFEEETFFATKADGGIYTTTHDFLKWENALWNNNILSEELRNLSYREKIKVSGSNYCSYQNRANTYYGLGWFIDKTNPYDLKIYHTGDNGGFQAYAAKYLKSKVNVIMFENRNDIERWSTQMEIERILKEEGVLQ